VRVVCGREVERRAEIVVAVLGPRNHRWVDTEQRHQELRLARHRLDEHLLGWNNRLEGHEHETHERDSATQDEQRITTVPEQVRDV
ncbi:hypothetical protein DF186_18660, partial [Enterococcus hirae]